MGVTLDNLDHLPKACRRCVYWELAPHIREQAEEFGQTDLEKEAWVSSVLLEWGSCGRIAMVGGVPAGYVLYAPPGAVPRSAAFPTSPVSADAVLLTGMRVLPEFAGSGIGRLLIQAVAHDLTGRGVKALESFGDARDPDAVAPRLGAVGDAAAQPPGPAGDPSGDDSYPACVTPARFLQSVGFKTVQPHPRWPRLRLELRSAMTWKADVEAALERLLETVVITPSQVESLRPART